MFFERMTTGDCRSYLVGCPQSGSAAPSDLEICLLDLPESPHTVVALRPNIAGDVTTAEKLSEASREGGHA